MSLSTYAELKTAVLDFAHRSDLSGVFDDLAARAEAGLNRKLRLIQQEQRTTSATTSGSRLVTLPTGFLEMISIGMEYGNALNELLPIGTVPINADRTLDYNGIPRYYRIGSSIELDIPADDAYPLQLHWFKKWDIVNDSTNWLLTNWPDLYMDAILAEIGLYTRDAEMAQTARASTMEKIDEAMQNDANNRTRSVMMVDAALTINSRNNFDIVRGY